MANQQLIAQAVGVASTDAYVLALKLERPLAISCYLLQLTEKNVNAIYYKILGSNVDVTAKYQTIKAETALAKNAATYETLSDPWLFVEVWIKAQGAGSQGSLDIDVSGV